MPTGHMWKSGIVLGRLRSPPVLRRRLLYYVLAMVLSIAVVTAFLAYPRDLEPQPTTTQGICGAVLLITGDCMPKPVGSPSSCTREYVSRMIYIREPATFDNMEGRLVPYLGSNTALIAQVRSNVAGFYELELPPGDYSVFVEDDGREYCNVRGVEGWMCPLTLKTEVLRYNIQIDHASW